MMLFLVRYGSWVSLDRYLLIAGLAMLSLHILCHRLVLCIRKGIQCVKNMAKMVFRGLLYVKCFAVVSLDRTLTINILSKHRKDIYLGCS